MKKMGELITAIENAGIRVKCARWENEDHLNIDVDDRDRAAATLIAQGWYEDQGEDTQP
ncbi:hypothetical protein [Paenibacillus sp. GYB003]|uniref:hypothetical protein n=1 Tax=Paenibacillus sp. GYB003 TaxID=2994392 RepID=UPI002F96CE60